MGLEQCGKLPKSGGSVGLIDFCNRDDGGRSEEIIHEGKWRVVGRRYRSSQCSMADGGALILRAHGRISIDRMESVL